MKFKKSRLEPLKITLDGNEYPAFITNGGMMELEELAGKSFPEIINMYVTESYTTKDLMHTTYIALKGGGVEVTLEDLETTGFSIGVVDILLAALNQYSQVDNILTPDKESGEKK